MFTWAETDTRPRCGFTTRNIGFSARELNEIIAKTREERERFFEGME